MAREQAEEKEKLQKVLLAKKGVHVKDGAVATATVTPADVKPKPRIRSRKPMKKASVITDTITDTTSPDLEKENAPSQLMSELESSVVASYASPTSHADVKHNLFPKPIAARVRAAPIAPLSPSKQTSNTASQVTSQVNTAASHVIDTTHVDTTQTNTASPPIKRRKAKPIPAVADSYAAVHASTEIKRQVKR